MVLQQKPKRSTVWGYANDAQRGQKVQMILSDDIGFYRTFLITIREGITDIILYGLKTLAIKRHAAIVKD